MYVTVNGNGQITLPVEARKKHNIQPGQLVEIIDKKGEIIIRKAAVLEGKVLDKMAAIAKQKKVTPSQIVKICREIRKQTYGEEFGE